MPSTRPRERRRPTRRSTISRSTIAQPCSGRPSSRGFGSARAPTSSTSRAPKRSATSSAWFSIGRETCCDAPPRLLSAALLDPTFALHTPDLLFAEVSNALWKKTRRRELNPGEARLVLRGLASVPLEVTPTRQLAAGALDLALEAGCTVYDAVYLALAIHHDCRLVTADQRLGRLIRPKTLVRH